MFSEKGQGVNYCTFSCTFPGRVQECVQEIYSVLFCRKFSSYERGVAFAINSAFSVPTQNYTDQPLPHDLTS